MNLTNIPTLVAVPFADGGTKNNIPVDSQIGITPGAASYHDGFPPVTFIPIASGGVPPYGADFNGVLNAFGVMHRWAQAGGRYYYNNVFAADIAGYPKGATLNRSDNLGAWINTVDGNTTDPDTSSAAGWLAVRANAVAVTIAVSAGANTPTKEKLGAQVLLCTGAIAAAATLVLPLTAGSVYVVHNTTTGAGSLTVIGASGAGVTIPQGVGYYVYTDGANFYGASADISGLYLPVNGTAVAATKLASPRNFSLGGTGSVLTSVAVPFDGSGNVVLNAVMADNALSIAKTNGLQDALDAKLPSANPIFSGNLTGPSAVTLQSNNSSGSINLRPRNGSTVGQITIDSSGNFVAAGTITPGSDERIKTNVQPITGALDTIRECLVGVEYDRVDQGGIRDAGFIAQRVKERLPHLVPITATHGFDDFHSVNYNGAVAYLSAAIVELHDIVQRQQSVIDAMSKKVD